MFDRRYNFSPWSVSMHIEDFVPDDNSLCGVKPREGVIVSTVELERLEAWVEVECVMDAWSKAEDEHQPNDPNKYVTSRDGWEADDV